MSELITNPKRSDGFGAQFQSIIYSVIFADLNQKKFVYTPFSAMEHNYDNDPHYLAKKESLINFISNFEPNPGIPQPTAVNDLYRFVEARVDSWAGTLKRIKTIFRQNKKFPPRAGVTAAIHVRRVNSHDNRSDYPLDATYLSIISKLKNNFQGQTLNLRIYSQGLQSEFDAYKGIENLTLHLNGPVEETFTEMATSDVLVTTGSSFSYVAGLLSDGDVYYIPFWHPPLPHWKITEKPLLPKQNAA